MKKYIVLKPFELDGKSYKEGDTLELADIKAGVQLEKGNIEEVPEVVTPTEIGSAIAKGLQPFLDEMKKVVANAKANPVGEDAKEVLLRENKHYRLSAFYTAVRRKDMKTIAKIQEIEGMDAKAITEGMTVGTAGDGGILVPALTDASIFEFIKTNGQALKYFSVIPQGQNVIKLPRVTSSTTGNWVGESSQSTPEKGTFTTDDLTPAKWVGMIPMSYELFSGANPSIGAYMEGVLGRAEAYAIDTKAFQNAATTLTGIFYASNTFGNTETLSSTNPNSITFPNLINCMYGVDFSYNPKPAWYMSRSVLALVMQLSDQNDRPIFNWNVLGTNPGSGAVGTLLGYPVYAIEQAPTSADVATKPIIIFGDLHNSVIGDVEGRRTDISAEGSVTINGSSVNLFDHDMVAVRMIKQYSLAPRTNGYSLIKTKT